MFLHLVIMSIACILLQNPPQVLCVFEFLHFENSLYVDESPDCSRLLLADIWYKIALHDAPETTGLLGNLPVISMVTKFGGKEQRPYHVPLQFCNSAQVIRKRALPRMNLQAL